jgi:hypothetical protein
MQNYKAPLLVDAFRLTGATIEKTIESLVEYYQSQGGGWNHLRAATYLRLGYLGGIGAEALVAGCKGDGRRAYLDNAKIVEAALPKILGRNTQAFDVPPITYAVTPTIRCAMGPAFFVTENGVVKLVYVHARNEKRASKENLASLAMAAKAEILDNEFFGQPGDLEIHFIDKSGSNRDDELPNLDALRPAYQEPYQETLSRFAKALLIVDEQRLAGDIVPKAKEKATPPNTDQGTLDF